MAKFCTNCGSPVEEDQKKCQYCGNDLKAKRTENEETSKTTTQNHQTTSTPTIHKSKVTAGLLAIFLGCFGVHNFYLGYNGKAIAQLLITVLSCCVLSEITALWGFIEGILILCGNIKTDAYGNELVD